MSKISSDTLFNAYFNSMNEFVEMVTEMTVKAIDCNKHPKVYQGDVNEVVQQVCYLMLNHEVKKEMFEGEDNRMYSYVYTIIKSCIVRISWGRGKYGDGYVLK